ncbi:class I SAM-dependent methyltransferase [Kiloniella laminariae]|uniref:Class I SAM-dependent methyltransferase n=1 Tax=Kiloniella laminariae TaxID=454162 RepID=A0ABT4LIV4_9PROT|nr:class I SAM-dependent methyltransferase [Kiloniella laminariae]MCZ4281023.1 class I SAM-dependent methyltransferase [Kiloniella laminariae]
MSKSSFQPAVQDQYEAYPYPARNPADEKNRLITGSPSNLAELNHYLFLGQRDFSLPFRALVAGGGTGDAAIMLAQQLADASPDGKGFKNQVTYLDLSSASRRVAEDRAKVRGLQNIQFLNGSLLDLPHMELDPFDYIDCCGVLHHLDKPEAGLKSLCSVLKQDGGMGLMVYGQYGRDGVYPLQSLLRELTQTTEKLSDKVKLTRRLLEKLPASNNFRRNPFLIDHKASDAELVDLLLHSCDRAYTVPQLVELVASSDLNLVGLIEPIRYQLETYLKDPVLLRAAENLDGMTRAAMAEKIASNIKMHVFYVTRQEDTVAKLEETQTSAESVIPVLREMNAVQLAASLKKSPQLKTSLEGVPITLQLPRLAAAIAQRCDGHKNLKAIFEELKILDERLEWNVFVTQFKLFYQAFNSLNHLFLKHTTR